MQSTANISLEGIEVLIAAEEEANFVYLKAVLEGEKQKSLGHLMLMKYLI
ncbi:MAG: hypothetical protein GY834_01720 [Bacteroidetes bacterium]|nr:hypothetical protein [Bacteroidota bacterium]